MCLLATCLSSLKNAYPESLAYSLSELCGRSIICQCVFPIKPFHFIDTLVLLIV